MGNLSMGEVVVLIIGGILALAGAISTIGGAVEKVVKVVRAARAPEKQQNAEIDTIKTRLDKIEAKLEKDKQQIDDIREGNHVLTKGMFALLEHGINGNNIDQMRDAKKDVEAYLINH